MAWQSIQEVVSSKDASKQKRIMALLLTQLHSMTKEQFERRMAAVYASDAVSGPHAIAFAMKLMATRCPPGKDRNFFLTQMDAANNDATTMKRVRKGWQAFGVTDPWFVIHPEKQPWLPRYNSWPSFGYIPYNPITVASPRFP